VNLPDCISRVSACSSRTYFAEDAGGRFHRLADGMFLHEKTVWSRALRVVVDGDPGLPQGQNDIGLLMPKTRLQ